jgi:hypothetical protein
MPNQRKASQVAITVYIDRDLKAAVRARIAEKGETLTDVVARALKRYVR